jgi:hypothetical protein
VRLIAGQTSFDGSFVFSVRALPEFPIHADAAAPSDGRANTETPEAFRTRAERFRSGSEVRRSICIPRKHLPISRISCEKRRRFSEILMPKYRGYATGFAIETCIYTVACMNVTIFEKCVFLSASQFLEF